MMTVNKKTRKPLGRRTRLLLFAFALFVTFLGHNYLQERIMALPGFHFGSMLSFFEAAGVLTCTSVERVFKGSPQRKSPIHFYLSLSMLLAVSSILSNVALEYINYPVKVVFRSSKIIPTMLIGVYWMKTTHQISEYLSAFLLSVGLTLFAFADKSVSPKFSPFGILLVCISVFADAVVPNLQKKLMNAGADRNEVVFYSNVFALSNMCIVSLLNGDLINTFHYCRENPFAVVIICIYMVVAYCAITTHVSIIQEFSPVTAVIIASARKAATIMLSFFLFPKPFSMYYAFGGALIFWSLIWTASLKNKTKKTDASGSVV